MIPPVGVIFLRDAGNTLPSGADVGHIHQEER